jgi:hypothetical protein
MTVHEDNAAGRLYRILGEFRAQQPGLAIPQAWSNALHVDQRIPLQLERRLLHVLQLPAVISADIETVPDDSFDREFAMRWYQPVQGTFQSCLFSSNRVDSVTSRYNEGIFASLENCSYVLHRFKAEPVKLDALSGISGLLDDIEHELAVDPDVDPELRAFLAIHVQAMKQAISDFFIIGASGLQEKFDQTIGALYRSPQIVAKAEKEAEADDKSASKKFFEVLAKIALILAVTQSGISVGHSLYGGIEHLTAIPAIMHVIAPSPPEGPIVS